VTIGLRWVSGGLLWIPAALSTINPTTSPRLSAIKLNFSGRPPWFTPVQLRERLENELRFVDEHVGRIEREFMGAVNVAVIRHPGFEVGGFGFLIFNSFLIGLLKQTT
jgi:hypothetical protein